MCIKLISVNVLLTIIPTKLRKLSKLNFITNFLAAINVNEQQILMLIMILEFRIYFNWHSLQIKLKKIYAIFIRLIHTKFIHQIFKISFWNFWILKYYIFLYFMLF